MKNRREFLPFQAASRRFFPSPLSQPSFLLPLPLLCGESLRAFFSLRKKGTFPDELPPLHFFPCKTPLTPLLDFNLLLSGKILSPPHAPNIFTYDTQRRELFLFSPPFLLLTCELLLPYSIGREEGLLPFQVRRKYSLFFRQAREAKGLLFSPTDPLLWWNQRWTSSPFRAGGCFSVPLRRRRHGPPSFHAPAHPLPFPPFKSKNENISFLTGRRGFFLL